MKIILLLSWKLNTFTMSSLRVTCILILLFSKGGWTVEQHDCPPGTDFNPAINNCDWSDNVPDNVCDGVTHKPPTGIALVGLTIISIVLNKQSK